MDDFYGVNECAGRDGPAHPGFAQLAMSLLATRADLPNLFRMRRHLLLCLVPLGLVVAARADWPRLPPVEGDLAGKLTWLALPAAPPVDWKITVRAAG